MTNWLKVTGCHRTTAKTPAQSVPQTGESEGEGDEEGEVGEGKKGEETKVKEKRR